MGMAQIRFDTEGAKALHRQLQKLTPKYTGFQLFSDFLILSRCALAGGTMEREYLETMRKYGKHEALVFPRAFGELVIAMERERKDVLGDYYTGAITHGEHGQFYTPENICEMMARIVEPRTGSTVSDPCCGSGRMLLASAEVNRRCTFHGQDIDFRCVEMCTLNLALCGLSGFIVWGDSLAKEVRRVFRTGASGTLGRGVIVEVDSNRHDFTTLNESRRTITKIKESGQAELF